MIIEKMKVVISPSTRKLKKFMAVFSKDGKKVKTTHFGDSRYSDYTKHKDTSRMRRYVARHKGDRVDDYMTPGALSRWVLWSEPTLSAGIARFKKRFKLK